MAGRLGSGDVMLRYAATLRSKVLSRIPVAAWGQRPGLMGTVMPHSTNNGSKVHAEEARTKLEGSSLLSAVSRHVVLAP